VVLVHGAYADSSSWNGVIERLQAAGVRVTAPANPLRGLIADSAYLESYLEQIPGSVLAVGHSYAGSLISNAATDASNVVGLVFVAAFATDEGEIVGEVAATSKDSILGTQIGGSREPRSRTSYASTTAVRFSLSPPGYPGDLPCPAKGAAIKNHNDEDQSTLQRGTLGVRQERYGKSQLH
jgi:pimeloyl-ACP methyl ester carboxylesterase